MPFKRAPMRYAHANGYTHCIYSEDGDYIITCGADGDIRKWAGINDDDPTSQCVGEYTLCIAQYGDHLLVSTDLNTVQSYTYPDGDRDGTHFRFKAGVTCIKVDSTHIAACSEDMQIKIVPLDKSEPAFDLIGHEGTVLKIDLSPNGYLASSSGDGTIKIWKIDEKIEIKSLPVVPKTKTFYSVKSYATPSFEPVTGKYLAFPQEKQIQFFDTNNWESSFTLTDDNITSDYTVCSFSPCGLYMAAGTNSGELSIWEVNKHRLTKGDTKGTGSYAITSIAWSPKNDGELAYCDINGELGTIIDGYDKMNVKTKRVVPEPAEELDLYGDDIEFNDDEDDADNENCVSLEKLKNETLKHNGLPYNDDNEDITLVDDKSRPNSRSVSEICTTKTFPIQPPFQPSSTPIHLEHRYLLWNHVGIVRAHKTHNENSIEVEFHDVSVHHGIQMNNYLHHTMASLSTTVLALSGETPSKLVCIAIGSSGSREWSTDMPNCEEVVAVTASDKLVAVATDSRFLRVFSVMGTQREVISIPGPVISLAGHDDKLMIAYHSSPATTDQHISVMMLNAVGLTLRCKEVKLPLTPGSKLAWIGYSDKGSPVIFDSLGFLRMYSSKSNLWFPICDTSMHAKGVSDTFFIVDISEVNQLVRVVLCRGSSFPLTTPRPIVSELPMQLPFCDIGTEKSILEESLIRYANFEIESCDKLMKETSIKLFAFACRTEMESRAKELIEMIASPQLLPLAVKYATKLGRIHLAEQLSELRPAFEEQEKEREKKLQILELENELLCESPLNTSKLLVQQNKETPPHIAPKPMIVSQNKRNPFKRASFTPTNKVNTPNALSHLTGNAIGFGVDTEVETEVDSLSGISPIETAKKTNPIVESNEQKKTIIKEKPTNKFMDWFNNNKEDLLKENPDSTPAELTKLGMRKFKQQSTLSPHQTNGKRKLEENDEKQSGVSKLAKFGFNKI